MTSSDKQATVYERQLDLALASIHACATRSSTKSHSVARPADAGSRGWRERLQARRSH